MQIPKEIKTYLPIIEGIVSLFNPFVEAAVHDLSTGEIAALYNNISRRKVGDPSPLHELKMPVEKFPDVFDPYYKTNWDGRRLKCTSITVRDEKGRPIALICFNFDTTVFREIDLNLKTLLEVKQTAENPIELFNENWQQRVNDCITNYLKENNITLVVLSKEQKKEAVIRLYQHGLFNYRRAADYIAEKMNISRATVYNYLKEGVGAKT